MSPILSRTCSRCGGCVVDAPTALRVEPPAPGQPRAVRLCSDCSDLLTDFLRGAAPTPAALCQVHN